MLEQMNTPHLKTMHIVKASATAVCNTGNIINLDDENIDFIVKMQHVPYCRS